MKDKNQIRAIAQRLIDSKKIIVFTGAGISTESGIPDYRSKGGIWDKFTPIYFSDFMSSKTARIEYWRRKEELYQDLLKAKPNKAHMALAELYKMDLLEAIITQNIDGLHQLSGLPDEVVIELHGNNRRVRCMSCSRIFSLKETHEQIRAGELAPECPCGGFLKPDTISFGQSLRQDILKQALELSRSCDFFLVIGSTLLVQPAAQLPVLAKQKGAFLTIVNLSGTPCDKISDILIHKKAGEVLSELVVEVKRIS